MGRKDRAETGRTGNHNGKGGGARGGRSERGKIPTVRGKKGWEKGHAYFILFILDLLNCIIVFNNTRPLIG